MTHVGRDILEATQEEQSRIGSELRDGLCQELAGTLMFVKTLMKKMENGKQPEISELGKISELISTSVKQARDMAQNLYPGELDGTSLVRMLEELASNTQSTSGAACRFLCHWPILIHESHIANSLYKIAREGIKNAVLHGRPQLIDMSLTQAGGHTILTITDDGVGFGGNPKKQKGIGLKLAKYRSQMMNASFQTEPNVPHGVILTCKL